MKTVNMPISTFDYPKNHIGRLLLSLEPGQVTNRFADENYSILSSTIQTIERHNPEYEYELQNYAIYYVVKRLK